MHARVLAWVLRTVSSSLVRRRRRLDIEGIIFETLVVLHLVGVDLLLDLSELLVEVVDAAVDSLRLLEDRILQLRGFVESVVSVAIACVVEVVFIMIFVLRQDLVELRLN